jgi:hypothetical protein
MGESMIEYIIIIGICALIATGILFCFPLARQKPARLPPDRKPATAAEAKERIRRISSGADSIRGGMRAVATAAERFYRRIPSARRKERVDRELYTAMGILRNYARASGGAKTTTDAILEQFAGTDGTLREAYAGSLRLLRTGREKAAVEFFTAQAESDMARDFMMLLLEWDRIAPERLTDTINSFRTAMKETRTTELLRKNEGMSDIVYLPVVAGVLVIFMNFIYIAYFVEQKELLAELFF